MRPQRGQSTRLPRPWDSAGKNTGVGCHFLLQCMKMKSESEVAQSCPTLCNPIDGSPPGSPVPEILQARTLEWGAISFSNAWKWKVKGKSLSRVWLFATPWTAAYQAPLSMGFSRQEYWIGVPLPSPSIIICFLFLPDIYFVSTWSDINISTHFPIWSLFICFIHPFTFNLPISSYCVWSKLPVDSKYSWFILYNLHNNCF